MIMSCRTYNNPAQGLYKTSAGPLQDLKQLSAGPLQDLCRAQNARRCHHSKEIGIDTQWEPSAAYIGRSYLFSSNGAVQAKRHLQA